MKDREQSDKQVPATGDRELMELVLGRFRA